MAKKRDYYRYELKRARKVVYRGITNDPERRETEHCQEGKNFTRMRVIGPAVTKETAKKWEVQSLQRYRKSHSGKNPEYNETD